MTFDFDKDEDLQKFIHHYVDPEWYPVGYIEDRKIIKVLCVELLDKITDLNDLQDTLDNIENVIKKYYT